MDLVKPDPGLIQSNPEPIVYRCKHCRRIVAAKSNILTHQRADLVKTDTNKVNTTSTAAIVHVNVEPTANSTANFQANDLFPVKGIVEKFTAKLRMDSVQTQNSEQSSDADNRCREILFVEPLTWMTNVCKQTQGKLNCPKCQCKLGNFTWINACNCPCGKNVSPAFYLVASKVELTRTVQNVEITV